MRVSKLVPAAAVLLACAAGGCGDAVSTEPITLTQPEVTLLLQEIGTAFAQAGLLRAGAPLMATGGTGPRFAVTASISEKVNCSGGGQALFSGTDNSVPPAKNIDASATFNGCKTAHYQLDGILRRSFVSSANGGTTTTTGSGDLSLKVLADGRSGTCHQDFSLTVAPDGITATGSICGVDATAALK